MDAQHRGGEGSIMAQFKELADEVFARLEDEGTVDREAVLRLREVTVGLRRQTERRIACFQRVTTFCAKLKFGLATQGHHCIG